MYCVVFNQGNGKKTKNKTKPIGSRSNCKAQLCPYLFQIKIKEEIDIYIVSAECPWKVELHFAPFMLKLNFFSSFMETCSAAAQVSGYWWVSRCCSSLHSLCSADKSTHQRTRGVFLSLSLFPPPVSSPEKQLSMGLVAIHPQEMFIFFCLK